MFDKQILVNIHIREAASLTRLLDGTPEDLARFAASYGVSEDWKTWVNRRIKYQLEKAKSASQRPGRLTSVPVASGTFEYLSMEFPTLCVLIVAESA